MEEYNEYGDIKPKRVIPQYNEHRIHETKDIFDGNCYLCQKAMKAKVESYWDEDA